MMTTGSKRQWNGIAWLWHDLTAIARLLRKGETWIFIGVALAFGVLGGVSLYFATGLDVSLQLRHLQKISCASASDLQSAAIIFGGTAFILAGLAAFGELATYVDEKRLRRQRVSGRRATVVTVVALLAGTGLLWLMMSICT